MELVGLRVESMKGILAHAHGSQELSSPVCLASFAAAGYADR